MDPNPLEQKIRIFENLLGLFDVKLKCPDYTSDQKLSGNQKRHDEKISKAVANLLIFWSNLSQEELADLSNLAGRNKNGKHDPLKEWWKSFSGENRVTCHNELARQGKKIIGVVKENLKKP